MRLERMLLRTEGDQRWATVSPARWITQSTPVMAAGSICPLDGAHWKALTWSRPI